MRTTRIRGSQVSTSERVLPKLKSCVKYYLVPHRVWCAISTITVLPLVIALPSSAAVVNVTCTNATTDTPALNNAISGSNVGDQIAIHGTCLINGIIVLYGDRSYLGDSRTGTVIRQAAGSNLSAMLASDSWMSGYQYPAYTGNPIHISHLTLDGNSAMNSSTSALIIRSWLTVVDDLLIENAPVDAIQITNLNQGNVALSNSEVNGRISNCFITGSGANGIHVVDTGNSVTDWDILDSWIANSGQSAIMMDNAAGWKVRGNHLYGVPANGIFASRCFGTAIDGNYIEDFGHLGGVETTYYGIACTVQGAGAGSVITSNKIYQNPASGGDSSTGTLIYIGLPQVNYGTGVVNVVNNVINGGNGANTFGLAYYLGAGSALDVLASGNNVQSVATPQVVGLGVTLVGQPVVPVRRLSFPLGVVQK